jgi:hypothetical protein
MTRRSECGVNAAELRLRQTGVVIGEVDHAGEIMSAIFSTGRGRRRWRIVVVNVGCHL